MTLIHISYWYSDLIVDYFYTKTFIGCRPTFYHPFWDYGRATLASLVSTVLLYIFRLNANMMNIIIALNLWFVFTAFLYSYIVEISIFYKIYETYQTKETLLFSVNFLCGIYLMNERSELNVYVKKN